MAQARLPIYYQRLGVPDTLNGRFVMLSLHLFAVLHRLKEAGGQDAAKTRTAPQTMARATAQALSDRFAADMETVLREIGTGDLAVPKKVRKLVAQGASLLEGYERAVAAGGDALEVAIADALPLDASPARAASAQLTPYMSQVLQDLSAQPLEAICKGRIRFPELSSA
ncbi:ubiquinol-cytochrome C chaperone family protein [Methyloceanibacter methanicus]|nr:ubiquinol-cytochrome C chaperone family protein [Methyloceanibacter methanicus]